MGVVGCGLAIYITPRLRQFASLAFMPPTSACTQTPAKSAGVTLAPHASAGVVVGRYAVRDFKQFAWLGVGSGKMALSHAAHQRITQTVGR